MKAFAWMLTAAAILIGADVLVKSPDSAAQRAATPIVAGAQVALHGGSGMPPLPPDSF